MGQNRRCSVCGRVLSLYNDSQECSQHRKGALLPVIDQSIRTEKDIRESERRKKAEALRRKSLLRDHPLKR